MQLQKSERLEIAHFLEKGYSVRTIASIIGKNPSTVSREIRRNTVSKTYNPEKAHLKQKVRRKHCRFRFKKIRAHPELEAYVERMLREKRSPEQIAGRWNLEHETSISCVTIYKYLHSPFGSHLCPYLLS